MFHTRFVSNKIINEFMLEYGKLPGILDAQDDGVSRSSIIVFFDRKVLKKKSIPTFFRNCPVQLFDVRGTLKDTQHIVKRINTENNVDLSIKSNRDVYNGFIDTINLCKKLLGRLTT